jgi:hypothetical protein
VFPFQPRWQPAKRRSLFYSPPLTAVYTFIDAPRRYREINNNNKLYCIVNL